MGWGFGLLTPILVILILIFVFPIILDQMSGKNLPECTTPLVKKCLIYIPSGGIFGGVTTRQVSCEKDYDYYIKMSSGENRNCRPVYEEYYNGGDG